MKNIYNITYEQTNQFVVRVEAETPDEAKEIALYNQEAVLSTLEIVVVSKSIKKVEQENNIIIEG